jgi:hypothetical protein
LTASSPSALVTRWWHTKHVDDEELLSRAEQALTQIKVNAGLSEDHADLLAALRIRLTGSEGASLETMLAAADDAPSVGLDEHIAGSEREPAQKLTLDDLLQEQPNTNPEWPS